MPGIGSDEADLDDGWLRVAFERLGIPVYRTGRMLLGRVEIPVSCLKPLPGVTMLEEHSLLIRDEAFAFLEPSPLAQLEPIPVVEIDSAGELIDRAVFDWNEHAAEIEEGLERARSLSPRARFVIERWAIEAMIRHPRGPARFRFSPDGRRAFVVALGDRDLDSATPVRPVLVEEGVDWEQAQSRLRAAVDEAWSWLDAQDGEQDSLGGLLATSDLYPGDDTPSEAQTEDLWFGMRTRAALPEANEPSRSPARSLPVRINPLGLSASEVAPAWSSPFSDHAPGLPSRGPVSVWMPELPRSTGPIGGGGKALQVSVSAQIVGAEGPQAARITEVSTRGARLEMLIDGAPQVGERVTLGGFGPKVVEAEVTAVLGEMSVADVHLNFLIGPRESPEVPRALVAMEDGPARAHAVQALLKAGRAVSLAENVVASTVALATMKLRQVVLDQSVHGGRLQEIGEALGFTTGELDIVVIENDQHQDTPPWARVMPRAAFSDGAEGDLASLSIDL